MPIPSAGGTCQGAARQPYELLLIAGAGWRNERRKGQPACCPGVGDFIEDVQQGVAVVGCGACQRLRAIDEQCIALR